MIESLHIENIAVVRSLDVDLSRGMTVLTGETGAGKSIIIDSLNLLLGGRADRELIRNGESRGEVSALFSEIPEGAVALLTELGFSCPDGTLMQNWGTRDFEHAPDKEKALAFVAKMTKFYREEAKPFLYNGRMIDGLPVECGFAPFGHNLPEIL